MARTPCNWSFLGKVVGSVMDLLLLILFILFRVFGFQQSIQ